jgi:polysaccharide biosynthesis protein PslH
MRVKVLEAMARGKPVVATPLAVRGLPRDAIACTRVADGLEPFAHAVLALLDDPASGADLGRRARDWAERWMATERVVERYDDLYVLLDALAEVSP